VEVSSTRSLLKGQAIMEERSGEAFEGDEPFTVIGRKLQPGEAAPDFSLDYLDLAEMTIRSACLADSAGMVRLLSAVNSLDMPVCSWQTKRWEELSKMLPAGICLYTISMDHPHTQARWQAAEQVMHQALSASRSEQFGQDYGLLLKERRLLQRATVVINRHDRIVYMEYVDNQLREPDYATAIAALRQAVTE